MDVTIREATTADADGMRALIPRLAGFDLPPRRNPRHLWMHDLELLERWVAGDEPECRIPPLAS